MSSDTKVLRDALRLVADERGRDGLGRLYADAADTIEALEGEVVKWEKNHEALQEKVDCMKSCGCAYDAAGDVCGCHSPALKKAEARAERLRVFVAHAAKQRTVEEMGDEAAEADFEGGWNSIVLDAREFLKDDKT
jgi:hypothetical protein